MMKRTSGAREAAAFQRGKESMNRVVKQLVAEGELVAAPKRPQASPTARPTRHACKGTDPVSGNHGRITWRKDVGRCESCGVTVFP